MKIKNILFFSFISLQCCFGSVDEIVEGIRKIEIGRKIFPALLDKDQLCVLIPVLKACHRRVESTEKEERDKLEKIKDEIKKSEKDVMEKGLIPDIKVSDKIKSLLEEFKNKRNIVVGQNIQDVSKALTKELKPWQKSSLGLSETNPQILFDLIRYTFLDLLCYEILFSNLKRLDPKRAEGLK